MEKEFKIYSRNLVGSDVVKEVVTSEMGLEIRHCGKAYVLDMDRDGNLSLTSIGDKLQLSILPKSSNKVVIEAL